MGGDSWKWWVYSVHVMSLNWLYANANVPALDAGASTTPDICVVNPDGVVLPVDSGLAGLEF